MPTVHCQAQHVSTCTLLRWLGKFNKYEAINSHKHFLYATQFCAYLEVSLTLFNGPYLQVSVCRIAAALALPPFPGALCKARGCAVSPLPGKLVADFRGAGVASRIHLLSDPLTILDGINHVSCKKVGPNASLNMDTALIYCSNLAEI